MPMSSAEVEEFLDKLNNDVDFRDTLKNDPATIFDQYDIPYDSGTFPALSERTLPPVGEVNSHRETYRDTLFPGNDFMRNEHKFDLDV